MLLSFGPSNLIHVPTPMIIESTDDEDEDADVSCKINVHEDKVGMCIALVQD